jgi:plastocyanin
MGGSMSPAGAATVNVAIGDFSFAPATITVRVGTTVRWTNNGPSTHTVMNDAGSWASSPLVPPAMTGMGMGYGMDGMDGMGGMSSGTMGMGSGGGAFQFTFTHPGTFPYHCALHPPAKYPGFVGLVTVTP